MDGSLRRAGLAHMSVREKCGEEQAVGRRMVEGAI
jgi:hypothetical protein